VVVHRSCTLNLTNNQAISQAGTGFQRQPNKVVNGVIVNTTRVRVSPENRNEFFQTVCPLLEPIRNEKGCVAYRFFVEATDESTSLLVGEWQTPEDWSNHLQSRDFAVLLGAITVLGSPEAIEFRLLSSVPLNNEIERPDVSKLATTIFSRRI
jgi:quinol monooxygenase YgiN